VMALGEQAQIANVAFRSAASKAGWESGWDVQAVLVPNPHRPSDFWVYVPALLLLAGIWVVQGRRARRSGAAA